jgi:hypothetical protein
VLPKVAETVFCARQLAVFPRVVEFLRGRIKIENGQVISFPFGGASKPDSGFVGGEDGMIAGGVLVDGDDFGGS